MKLIDLITPITENKCKHCITGLQNSNMVALIRCDLMGVDELPSGFFHFTLPELEICTMEDWAECPLNKEE